MSPPDHFGKVERGLRHTMGWYDCHTTIIQCPPKPLLLLSHSSPLSWSYSAASSSVSPVATRRHCGALTSLNRRWSCYVRARRRRGFLPVPLGRRWLWQPVYRKNLVRLDRNGLSAVHNSNRGICAFGEWVVDMLSGTARSASGIADWISGGSGCGGHRPCAFSTGDDRDTRLLSTGRSAAVPETNCYANSNGPSR